ncbi:hypothetical protein CsatB_003100 [Cannabis sativa]|uniref:Uncharacterized protein n=1 Tax=Cannabis sativa TaxID=3483 RepID=A0A803PQZ7_CANSA
MDERVTVCFCFSSKKSNGKGSRSSKWEKKENLLSDMSTFSVKEQERRLKKALKEEDKASKEAEKVVQWVKQESARMDADAIHKILTTPSSTTATNHF